MISKLKASAFLVLLIASVTFIFWGTWRAGQPGIPQLISCRFSWNKDLKQPVWVLLVRNPVPAIGGFQSYELQIDKTPEFDSSDRVHLPEVSVDKGEMTRIRVKDISLAEWATCYWRIRGIGEWGQKGEWFTSQLDLDMPSALEASISDDDAMVQSSKSSFSDSRPHVVFINPAKKEVFWQMVTAVMRAAASDLNIDLEVISLERDRLSYQMAGKKVLDRSNKPDYLILVNEKGGAEKLISYGKNKGVKLFLIVNGLLADQVKRLGKPREKLEHWIGSMVPDNENAGFLAAKYLLEHVQQQDVMRVAAVAGAAATPASLDRVQGFRRAVSLYKNVDLKQVVPNPYWSRKHAVKIADGLLSRYPDLNVFWAANDPMALGVVDAARKIGRQPGKDVWVSGVGWVPPAMQALQKGDLLISVGGHFLIGGWVMVLLHDHAEGVDFADEKVFFQQPMFALTAKNVDAYLSKFGDRNWDKIRFNKFSKAENPKLSQYNFGVATLMNKDALVVNHNDKPVTAVDAESTVAPVIASGHPNYPPIVWQFGESLVGVGPELFRICCRKLGLPFQIRAIPSWSRVQAKARNGDIDAIVGLYKNEERQRYLTYLQTYLQDYTSVFAVNSASFNVDSREDLNDLNGVALLGDSFGENMDAYIDSALNLQRAHTVNALFKNLFSNRSDYVLWGYHPCKANASRLGVWDKMKTVKKQLLVEKFYIALADNGRVKNKVESFREVLSEVLEEKNVDELVTKYLHLYAGMSKRENKCHNDITVLVVTPEEQQKWSEEELIAFCQAVLARTGMKGRVVAQNQINENHTLGEQFDVVCVPSNVKKFDKLDYVPMVSNVFTRKDISFRFLQHQKIGDCVRSCWLLALEALRNEGQVTERFSNR